MGTQQVGLNDVRQVGRAPSRLRLLAPLRYLWIYNPEKSRYDYIVPLVLALATWAGYSLISPKPALFGADGLLKFARDLLVMAVPFMVGALATVAMAGPSQHLDSRPTGTELYLDGETLTLRQFVCYLLGYLSFLGLLILGAAVGAELLHATVLSWIEGSLQLRRVIHSAGSLLLFTLLSSLAITVFWSLYFLTDVVNRKVKL
jgi:hypothetical protein